VNELISRQLINSETPFTLSVRTSSHTVQTPFRENYGVLVAFFTVYGGEEYEEATYGRGEKAKKTYFLRQNILPSLLSSVDIYKQEYLSRAG